MHSYYKASKCTIGRLIIYAINVCSGFIFMDFADLDEPAKLINYGNMKMLVNQYSIINSILSNQSISNI